MIAGDPILSDDQQKFAQYGILLTISVQKYILARKLECQLFSITEPISFLNTNRSVLLQIILLHILVNAPMFNKTYFNVLSFV